VSAAVVERERRKVVTVVFADVVGSTALGERVDAETLRWAMRRWFDRMREVIERHGGTIENYIGDAVMAVFGIPVAHEDDALRAVRAAAQMREAIVVLRDELQRERGIELAVRIGVNTGEAVTGAGATAGSFTAGDTVNVAARLEQSARPGDVLLGRDTFRLVRHAVEAEPVAPLMVKGKEEAVEAFRLVEVGRDDAARPRRPHGPMVGRHRERRRVLDAFHQAVADRSCQLFTVLGAPGVGKSRLVTEVLETIGDSATVAVGRCLPYGDGLTHWPLVEALDGGLLEQAATDDEAAAARVAELLKPEGEPLAPDETFWAVRRVLEALAGRRPLVLVIDDLQWAEPVFVDLVEHVAERTRDTPLLLLIMARNELLDARAGWGGGKLNATTVLLEPLPENDARDLVHNLVGPERLDDDAVEQILALAEGNPLFVEESVAMVLDEALSATAVPPTIHALIAARLDRLAPDERAVIEAASIEGAVFARGSVATLVRDGVVDAHLDALVRKDLVRPVASSDGTFRFRHQLICDGAYDAMPKALRAEMHERFANWLDERPGELAVGDELLGYHLERAVVLRRELGESDAATAELAARASRSLYAAGRRAVQREDHSSVRLFERAVALTPPGERARVLVEFADALDAAGDVEGCAATVSSALDLALATGDRAVTARARMIELRMTMLRSKPGPDLASLNAAAKVVLDELEEVGDVDGMVQMLLNLGDFNQPHFETASAYLERGLALAERHGLRWRSAFAGFLLGIAALYGPVPAEDGIELCRALRRRFAYSPGTAGALLRNEAVFHAMQGRIDHGRALHDEADQVMADVGSRWWSAEITWTRVWLEQLAGAHDRAAAAARAGLDAFTDMGTISDAAAMAAVLAVELARQGAPDAEVIRYADLAASWAAADDPDAQCLQLIARANVFAARGELEEAESAARDAVRHAERCDDISQRGDMLVDLAAILERRGSAPEAAGALRDAIALYERKGNVVQAGQARSMLGQLQPLGAGE
jgi:class 3 adenylate cyclase/tetratricopeptide (TPR) repeat protein